MTTNSQTWLVPGTEAAFIYQPERHVTYGPDSHTTHIGLSTHKALDQAALCVPASTTFQLPTNGTIESQRPRTIVAWCSSSHNAHLAHPCSKQCSSFTECTPAIWVYTDAYPLTAGAALEAQNLQTIHLSLDELVCRA